MFKIETNTDNKSELYEMILDYACGLTDGETDTIANLSNISALLNQTIDNINWVGFYIARDTQLVLGPFQGKVACIRIESGKGVCGTAFASGKTQLVKNVHEFAGHIACDGDTNSEIVVPIIVNQKLVAVLDIDSPSLNRFDETDKQNLEKLCSHLSCACTWDI